MIKVSVVLQDNNSIKDFSETNYKKIKSHVMGNSLVYPTNTDVIKYALQLSIEFIELKKMPLKT